MELFLRTLHFQLPCSEVAGSDHLAKRSRVRCAGLRCFRAVGNGDCAMRVTSMFYLLEFSNRTSSRPFWVGSLVFAQSHTSGGRKEVTVLY